MIDFIHQAALGADQIKSDGKTLTDFSGLGAGRPQQLNVL